MFKTKLTPGLPKEVASRAARIPSSMGGGFLPVPFPAFPCSPRYHVPNLISAASPSLHPQPSCTVEPTCTF